MKKTIRILVLLSLLFTAACGIAENVDENEGSEEIESAEETEISEDTSGYVKSSLARETSPEVDVSQLETIAEDNTAFALSFFKEIHQESGNIIFSPFSLSLALNMALSGAETSTEAAMMEALQFTLPEEDIHSAFNALLLEIEESQQAENTEEEGDQFQLNIANSIWGQSGYDFNETFLDKLALNYGAGIYNVDFMQYPEEARNAINEWIEEETEEKIKDLIPEGTISPLTRLVLANAIYFNGSWLYPFNEDSTEEAEFTLLDGSQTTVDMMSLTGESLDYYQGETYQVIQLPYFSTDFVMTIIVPDSGEFTAVEDELSPEMLSEILNNISPAPVDIKLPKFDFDTTVNANEPLTALGMAEAFDADNADFSDITEEEVLFITDVLHKATIIVDEGGTEAAAATAIIMGIKSAMPEEAISLVIDRPFLFFIQHEPTGSILFMGRVTEP